MKEMRRSLGVLMAVVLLLAFAEQASAFCVYNQTDKNIRVEQTGGYATGRGFKTSIKPGENACCHWTNRGCNKSGQRDQWLSFKVSYKVSYIIGGDADGKSICSEFLIRAGGALTVEGSGDNYRCVAHGY